MPSAPCILADLIKHLTEYRHSRKTDLISVENLLSTVNGIPSVPPSPPLGLGAHSRRRCFLRSLEEAIMAVLDLSWFGRHIGLFGAKERHVGAKFKSVIWMFGLFKIF